MKTAEKLTLTLTQLQAANAAHDQAVVDLHDHRCCMSALRSRIKDLGAAIQDLNSRAAKQPSLATLTLDQIKALSASKAAEFAELSGLNAALDVAEAELKSMESDERGHRMFVADTKTGAWAALYDELKEGVDLDALAKVAAVGIMAGMRRPSIADELLGDDQLDAELVESLATAFGMPL